MWLVSVGLFPTVRPGGHVWENSCGCVHRVGVAGNCREKSCGRVPFSVVIGRLY